ncbi:MAG: ribosome biogenesis factor YjgA [Methylophilaceae bacterium]
MQDKHELTSHISKTRLKAEAEAQQAIGKKLIALPKDRLNKLTLPEALYEAVTEAKRLTANGAVRRQLQYIGRLMRDIDTAPIVEHLSRWEGNHQQENARFHSLERWRDRLISESNSPQSNALQEFVAHYPHADIQQLRTLSRNAQKEQFAQKSPKSSRELFKLLRETSEHAEADLSPIHTALQNQDENQKL